MRRFIELIQKELQSVVEIMPWDAAILAQENPDLLILDVREADEFATMHIKDSLHVPRGILESACEWDYEETKPELVKARERQILVVCRSGNRSLLAAYVLQRLGFSRVLSLKTGLRGWKDDEQPLQNAAGHAIDLDDADVYFTPRLRPEQHRPKD